MRQAKKDKKRKSTAVVRFLEAWASEWTKLPLTRSGVFPDKRAGSPVWARSCRYGVSVVLTGDLGVAQ
jgi:hypothetical protein